ncbi:MAG TPA: KTSC domain-containing protein [Candidatus Sulfotelmatobacter sp.]
MEMKKVHSSHLRAVGYDPAVRTLHVEFNNGDVYEYKGVPREFHSTLSSADSTGAFFSKHVKPYFVGRRIN